jgi:transposase-like protein
MAGRRQYNAEFKAKVVLEVLSGEKTPSDVCREHKLNRERCKIVRSTRSQISGQNRVTESVPGPCRPLTTTI